MYFILYLCKIPYFYRAISWAGQYFLLVVHFEHASHINWIKPLTCVILLLSALVSLFAPGQIFFQLVTQSPINKLGQIFSKIQVNYISFESSFSPFRALFLMIFLFLELPFIRDLSFFHKKESSNSRELSFWGALKYRLLNRWNLLLISVKLSNKKFDWISRL